MNEIIIRKASEDDCFQMLELVKELALFEKAPDEVTVTLDHFKNAGFGPNPVWWSLVAEVEGKIIGIALYYIRYSTWKGTSMYLEDIVVTESFRGKGIGKQLLDALILEAKEKGFTRICWQVLEWNEPAIQFYKKYNATFDGEWVNCSIDL
ncbi:MAG: GNAT family N-acetyltransferase [Chitinophagaceae bacterium]|nr:MAG: GNAT family N-acetyltransferase [Chitinophagaceae bacterium]